MQFQLKMLHSAVLLLLITGGVWAQQVGWPQCPEVSEKDFTVERIVTRAKDNAHSPIKLAFHQVGQYTNFYFNQLHGGKIRYYDEATNSVMDVGTVADGYWGGKNKFSGLVLDPDFEKNRWIYAHYSGNGFFRVARYTITPSNKLDPSSLRSLLEVKKMNSVWHGDCPITFDSFGDLWIGYGDNGGYRNHSTNAALCTKDLRASILRIRPTEEKQPNGKYYTIPKDNMGEYWSRKFAEMGETELAEEYADPSKVLPEIYAKGLRNPYTIKAIYPTKRWLAFGDVGPDERKISEEFHILKEPGFAGWPIWAGQEPYFEPKGASINVEGITRLAEASSRGGASGLPPVIRSEYDVHQSSAVAGPIYWYDGNLKSDRKFPAYYHGKWFVGDNDESAWDKPPWIKVLTMNEDYSAVVDTADFFEFTKERIQEIYFGPDGAMYIAYFYLPWFGDNARNEIVRISYNGTGNENCLPGPELVPPFQTVSTHGKEAPLASKIRFTALGEFQVPDWSGSVQLFDILGKEVPLRHLGNGIYRLLGRPVEGVYFLKAGVKLFKVSNIGAG